MRRALTAVCLVSIAACASGASSASPASTADPAAAATPLVDVGTVLNTRSALALVRDSEIASHSFRAEAGVLWPRLVRAFDDLNLPITSLSTSSRLVGTQDERLRRIAGQSVSRYFECPGTGYGNTASTEFVLVTVVGQIVPAAAGSSELHLATAATTRTAATNEARCRSTGRLERQIRDALTAASTGS